MYVCSLLMLPAVMSVLISHRDSLCERGIPSARLRKHASKVAMWREDLRMDNHSSGSRIRGGASSIRRVAGLFVTLPLILAYQSLLLITTAPAHSDHISVLK